MKQANTAFCLIALTCMLTACAATSIFMHYPAQAIKYRLAINNNNEQAVLSQLDKKRRVADKQLYLMERGRIASLSGRVDESIEDYKEVLEQIGVRQDKAIISASETGAQAASLFTNDNSIPYSASAYEQVFIHQYQALNYLRKGKLEAATIETRRANFVQSEANEKHHREIAKAQEKARKNQIDVSQDRYSGYFASMDAAVGKVKNSFQNAYTFYTSGLIYEMDNLPNDAYIDYKKALQIYPDNRHLQRDVLRLARSLGMREDLARYSKQFGMKAESVKRNMGSVVVLYEQGYVPMKEEIRLPVPTAHGLLTVAFPVYNNPWIKAAPLQVYNKTHEIGTTEVIVDVYALAAKALKEKATGMIVRYALRAAAKYEMQKKAGKQNALAGITAQLYNMVSENADRRSWVTLPGNAQTLRAAMKPGTHTLHFKAGQLQQGIDVTVRSNQITVVRVVNTGVRMIVENITL